MISIDEKQSKEYLCARPPSSASEYYAFANAYLGRKKTKIHRLTNALITIDYRTRSKYKFTISDADGRWITGERPSDYVSPADNITYIDERVAFIEDRFTRFNICHFLFDKMGRTVEFSDYAVDSYFLFSEHEYYEKVLSLLGLKQTVLIENDENIVTYRIKELLVSSSTFEVNHPGKNFRPDVIEMLEELRHLVLSDSIPSKHNKRIFVNRRSGSVRDVINKDTFNEILSEFGFSLVNFEDHSFAEQAKIVQSADIMLGVHGAGLTNALFFRDSSFKLLEILPPLCATAVYWKLAQALGFQYDAFISRDTEIETPDYTDWKHDGKLNRRDIIVDENEFRVFLKKHL